MIDHDNRDELIYRRTGESRASNEPLFKQMSHPILQTSLTVRGVQGGVHFFLVTPDQLLWISDGSNLVLTDTTGAILHLLKDISQPSYQVHTVARDGTLFYIDKDFHINALSKDQQNRNTLIALEESWEPLCVYCSPSNGDLLVGTHMSNIDRRKSKGKITRYNSNGQQLQIIQYDNNDEMLYSYPGYLSENRNGDIIVSDWHRVVVTDRIGRHRFTYRGPRKISPRGNCTDTLSRILFCDMKTKSVHVIDNDGQFLLRLLTTEENIIEPHSLSYDERNNLLWIGSYNCNTLCVYEYMDTPE